MADDSGRHAGHDPLLVAALLDDDAPASERAAAEALVRDCRECAALHADLIALSSATRALPVPARPRDFRLTAADASMLQAPVTGEPGAPTPRLTREMNDTHTTSAHASHDTILVASLADHSLAATEREAAEALVAACSLCAALHADLVALSAATRAMPTPRRPREYTLTADDAARLRPTGWRRLVAAFGSSRDMFSRPLAVGLTTLGLAGLLVTTLPSVLMQGSAASAPPPAALGGAARASLEPTDVTAGAPELAPTVTGAAAAAASAAPPAPLDSGRFLADQGTRQTSAPAQGATASGSSKATGGQTNDVDATGAEADLVSRAEPAVPTPILLSGALLLLGLGLFVLRWIARRAER